MDDLNKRVHVAKILTSQLRSPSGKIAGGLITYFMENKISQVDAWPAIALLLALEENRNPAFNKVFQELLELARTTLKSNEDVRTV